MRNTEWHAGFELWDGDTPLRDDEVALPFYREVELAAGSGSTFVQDNGGSKLRFSKSPLKKSRVEPQHAAYVTVSGDSMLPVMHRPPGCIHIKSYNNDEFIQPDKAAEIKIIGWEFWLSVLNFWNN